VKFFALGYINLVGFTLTSCLSELLVVTGEDEFKELVVRQVSTSIEVIKLHHELNIFY
jgi:hypothetical protein